MTLPSAIETHLAKREGHDARWALWCDAVNKQTGASEPFGIWSGDDHQEITINGHTRLFAGAQHYFKPDAIKRPTGIVVQSQSISLNGMTPEVYRLTRAFDLAGQRADLYLVLLNPLSGNLIGYRREFKGYVNAAPEDVPANNGRVTAALSLVSHFRDLTYTPNLYKSNAAQSALSGDTARRDATLTRAQDMPWGVY
ncbi:hypothetical protein [Yoonia sp. 208BN28-4]|uniref:hypothetical protein n=1 Tax=Yoonia sp. 208BN28-4 TaxID=3126505 RepID=UPI0030AC378C